MIIAILILIFSTALFLFYIQAACERILRGRCKSPLAWGLAWGIVDAGRLKFPVIRKALAKSDAPVDYPSFRTELKCDCVALISLLSNAAIGKRRLSRDERFLALYFRLLSATAVAVHIARLPEKPVLLKMTAVLDFLANMLGERIQELRFA